MPNLRGREPGRSGQGRSSGAAAMSDAGASRREARRSGRRGAGR